MRLLFACLIAICFCACRSTTERLEGYSVHGIDVSHYQSDIDWPELSRQDLHFAFVKATEGESLADHRFNTNWKGAREAGLRRGAYHFFRPDVPGLKQALQFIRNVDLQLGDLPPVLDIEVDGKVSDIVTVNRIRSWLQIVEKHYQVRPIIYTNLKYYNRYIAGNFDDYQVWMARYHTVAPSVTHGQRWTFWQYGNRGRIKGIEGDVDLNVFNGNLRELDALGYGSSPAVSTR
ncbi:MAG: GH25 family lysozyme [Bacteroidota bacterium]